MERGIKDTATDCTFNRLILEKKKYYEPPSCALLLFMPLVSLPNLVAVLYVQFIFIKYHITTG